jgi:hypothetical protein
MPATQAPLEISLDRRLGVEAAAYVMEVTRRTRRVVGPRLEGVWLFGSAALDDFAPDRSDIDIQAVSTSRLPLREREELVAALSNDALPCPARGLEFVLYAHQDLGQAAGPAYQLNLNTGARMQRQVAFDPGDDPRFWVVLDVSIGRQHGWTLHGPPARSAFPSLPGGLVLSAVRGGLGWHAAHAGPSVDTVLAACRGWAWASDRIWRSKADSARWARARLDDPGPVERAMRLRDGADEPPLSEPEVSAVVDAAHAALDVAGAPAW